MKHGDSTVHMTQIMQTEQQLSHRNISHSVSSVDLIGPCLTTQPEIHILKIGDATCIGATVLSSSFLAFSVSKQVTCWTARRRAQF